MVMRNFLLGLLVSVSVCYFIANVSVTLFGKFPFLCQYVLSPRQNGEERSSAADKFTIDSDM